MNGPIDRVRDDVAESEYDRRSLALVFLLFLVVLGAGVGTIAVPGTGPDENESTPTPGVVTITPVTVTPTPTPPGGPPGTATTTTTPTDAPTPTQTPTDDDDDDDDRTEATDTPSSTATPTDSDSGSSGGGGSSSVDLTTDGSTVLVQASDVAPGHHGQNAVTFENSGDATGRLDVENTTVVDHENSVLDPERATGDDATTGELAAALRVRLSVTYPDGTTEYLFGTASSYVSLASLDGANRTSTETLAGGERATVAFEWTLPASTGNEVQSDGAEFDVQFALRQTS